MWGRGENHSVAASHDQVRLIGRAPSRKMARIVREPGIPGLNRPVARRARLSAVRNTASQDRAKVTPSAIWVTAADISAGASRDNSRRWVSIATSSSRSSAKMAFSRPTRSSPSVAQSTEYSR